MSKETEQSKELLRQLLTSINLEDIEELKKITLNDADALSRAADVELFYKNHFSKVIKLFIQIQLEYIGKEAETTEQLMFGRGTINGLFLIKNWFDKQVNLSLSRFDKPETDTDTEA